MHIIPLHTIPYYTILYLTDSKPRPVAGDARASLPYPTMHIISYHSMHIISYHSILYLIIPYYTLLTLNHGPSQVVQGLAYHHAYHTILTYHPDLSISSPLLSVSNLASYHNIPSWVHHSLSQSQSPPWPVLSPLISPSPLFPEYHEEVVGQGHDNNLGGIMQLPAGLANIPAGIVNNVSGGNGMTEGGRGGREGGREGYN